MSMSCLRIKSSSRSSGPSYTCPTVTENGDSSSRRAIVFGAAEGISAGCRGSPIRVHNLINVRRFYRWLRSRVTDSYPVRCAMVRVLSVLRVEHPLTAGDLGEPPQLPVNYGWSIPQPRVEYR